MASGGDARERLIDIWMAWGLSPLDDQSEKQHQALEAVEAWLARGASDPEIVIRAVQVLLADPERPGWRNRPCWTALRKELANVWKNAGTGEDHILYAQALLLAAWPNATDHDSRQTTLLLDSAWDTVRGSKREAVDHWRTGIQGSGFNLFKTLMNIMNKWTAKDPAFSTYAGVAPSTQGVQDLPQVMAALSTMNAQLVEVGTSLKIHIEEAEMLAQANRHKHLRAEAYYRQLDLLWWGQARYCRAEHKAYRRIPDADLSLWWAAREAAELSTSLAIEPAAAYLVETLHALEQNIFEKRSLGAWMDSLYATLLRAGSKSPPVSERLGRIAGEDALGLSVTWTRLQAAHKEQLSGAANALALDLDSEIDRGQWAVWIFRESLLDLRLGQGT